MICRPLYLPLHVLLSFDTVSLSTNLITGAPVLVLRLVVDGTYLSLANLHLPGGVASSLANPTPKAGDHVCVMEMEWFEMSLRLCDNSQFAGDYQKVGTVYATVHVHTCMIHVHACMIHDIMYTCTWPVSCVHVYVYVATHVDKQNQMSMR